MKFQAFLLSLITSAAYAAPVTLRNVNVVDVEQGTVRMGVNVVLSGQTIRSVGRPAAGRSVNAKGKYLIPGLWDMHAHLWDAQPPLGAYVANGILGVRDMGSDFARTRKCRSEIEAGTLTGPRIYTPGTPLDGPGPEYARMSVVRAVSADQARRFVDTLDSQGADFIKVMSTLSRDAYFSLAQRARVIRAVFAGHVPESVTISQAIDARQKSMEHLFGIAIACSSEERDLREARMLAIDAKDYEALAKIRARAYDTYNHVKAIDLFRRMARFDVWQTPTLTLRKRLSVVEAEGPAETPERFQRDYEFHQKLVASMQSHGVGLLAGTDSGDARALHDELELLVQAGLTPAQALRTSTINPARYFSIDTQAGSIGRGKRADLVLLDGNPLEDIRNTRKVAFVILRGKLLDRKQLDRLSKRNGFTSGGGSNDAGR